MPRNTDLNAVSRQWEMLKLLPTKPPGITSREIKEQLCKSGYKITKRTVERDLQELSRPFPILCNDRGKPYGWYWIPGTGADLPAITLAEALSLMLVEEQLKPLLPQAILTSLQSHFKQAQAKLKTLGQDNAAAQWKNKVRNVLPTLPMLPPNINNEVLDTVQQALLYDLQIDVEYQAIYNDKPTNLTLNPLAMVQRGPITYLVATAFNYQDIRLYALHRVFSAEANAHPVNLPDNFDLDEYISNGALQFGEGNLKLKARINTELGNYLQESALSKDQIMNSDGEGYLLNATVSDSWQLRWWILSQGPGIKVLEPTHLREEIVESMKEALATYQQDELHE